MIDETKMEKTNKLFFSQGLLEWYAINKRDLPWRHYKNPYYVWVSEIMLQQTRVDTVIPYFHRFIEKFPTIESLSYAPEGDVLKAWEGLGYYSRVRNLQSAVREVQEHYGGVVPAVKEDVSALKGVGSYTAGAILSIAFNQPEPAVDGNVMRVLSRFFLLEADIAKGSTRIMMEQLARELILPNTAGEFNQALMELGATVCTPRSPKCLSCPVMAHCAGRLAGRAESLPIKTKAKPPRLERRAVALIEGSGIHAGKLLIRQRPQHGLLARMWELPHVEITAMPKKLAMTPMGTDRAVIETADAIMETTDAIIGTANAVMGKANAAGVNALSEAWAPIRTGIGRRRKRSTAAPEESHDVIMAFLQEQLASAEGLNIVPIEWQMNEEHIFSHILWDMKVYRCRYEANAMTIDLRGDNHLPPHYHWLDPNEMNKFPFPNVFLRILNKVELEKTDL